MFCRFTMARSGRGPYQEKHSFRPGVKLNSSYNFSYFMSSFRLGLFGFFPPTQCHFSDASRWHGENTEDLLFFTAININRSLKKYLKLCCDIKTQILEIWTKTQYGKHWAGIEESYGPLWQKHRMVQDRGEFVVKLWTGQLWLLPIRRELWQCVLS